MLDKTCTEYFVARHRLLATACVAVILAFIRDISYEAEMGAIAILSSSLILLAICILASVPFLSYRRALMVPLVAWPPFVVELLLFDELYRYGWIRRHYLAGTYLRSLFIGMCLATATTGVICVVAVWIRRRYWPVFPDGCCKHCGYDLQALTADRCPECGTAFVTSSAAYQ